MFASQICLGGPSDYFKQLKNKWHKEALIGGVVAKCLSCDMFATGACIVLVNFGLEYLKNINQTVDAARQINLKTKEYLKQAETLRQSRLKIDQQTKFIRLVSDYSDLKSQQLNKKAHYSLLRNNIILRQTGKQLDVARSNFTEHQKHVLATGRNLDEIQKELSKLGLSKPDMVLKFKSLNTPAILQAYRNSIGIGLGLKNRSIVN